MRKKIMRTGIAVLTVSSIFTMTAFAAEGDTWNENGARTTIEGTAYTVDPIIEVELPGELTFGINPLSLDADEDGTEDSQIISGEYLIVNNSNVPVLVGTTTKLGGGSNVEIKTALATGDLDAKTKDLTSSDGKKAIWMALLLPTTASAATEDGYTLGKITAPAAGTVPSTSTLKGKVIGSTDDDAASVLFELAANTGETIKPECISGFKFAGFVDPTKTYEEADEIKVTTVFTLNTLSANQVANSYKTPTGYDKTIVEPK